MKQNISLAPNNPSAWNYLRGVLDTNELPYSTVEDFVKLYSVAGEPGPAGDIVDLENPPPTRGAYLPCPLAIEFMADIWEKDGGKDGGKEPILRAIEVRCTLGHFLFRVESEFCCCNRCGYPLRMNMTR